LIADGCHVLAKVDDVFALLDLIAAVTPGAPQELPTTDAVDRQILDAVAWQPTTIDEIVAYTRMHVDDVALRLHRLEIDGVVALRGRWYEQCAVPMHHHAVRST
jgi:predicted Rossmann fold nucleotide-binding protein DprA/Smf involved in DNA uptake